jgi:hypothetical protein
MGSKNTHPQMPVDHLDTVAVPNRDVVASRPRLAGVEGFRVDGPEGRVGYVKSVSSETRGSAPDTLHVATGLFIVRVVPVPAADIVDIEPERRRVAIRRMVRRPRSPNIAEVLRRFLATVGNDKPHGVTPAKGGR